MSKPLFALFLCVAILAIAPSAQSTAVSEVRPYSKQTSIAFCGSHRIFTLLYLIHAPFFALPQVQSQFLRLADLLDSSIHRFQSSQSVADLDEIDDAINALEQHPNDPSVTSLTLRSYLAQREKILYVAAVAPFFFRISLPHPTHSGPQCSSFDENILAAATFSTDILAC
jgi:hypothetical protein